MCTDGWICFDKSAGMSSNNAMIRVRKIFGAKTGYVGTLDPFATGVLPIAVGRARHFIKYLDDAIKTYVFTVEFGRTTDTLDLTGVTTETTGVIPSEETITQVAKSFMGKSEQMPPRFSAIKINGCRACDLMRRGQDVELAKRPIEIFNIEIIDRNIEKHEMTLQVTCSKGTYVRSLARDIAEKSGSLGVVTSLRRTQCGFFDISRAVTMEKIVEMRDNSELQSVLIPVAFPLGDIPAISLESRDISALLCGRHVVTDMPACVQVRLFDGQSFCGICEIADGEIRPLSMYVN